MAIINIQKIANASPLPKTTSGVEKKYRVL